MATIQAEQDEQDRIIAAQQAALDTVVTSIQDLRLMGKHDVDDVGPSQDELSAPDPQPAEGVDIEMGQSTQEENGEIREPEEGGKDSNTASLSSRTLNPSATPFIPSPVPRIDTPLSGAPTPIPSSDTKEEQEEGEADDIEMGELAEEPEERPQPLKKKVREELEEGEASDSDLGSELTDISDD